MQPHMTAKRAAVENTVHKMQSDWPELYGTQQYLDKIIGHIEKYTAKLSTRLQ